MADFDPKDLPILDDVIEIEVDAALDSVEIDAVEIFDTEPSPDIDLLEDIEDNDIKIGVIEADSIEPTVTEPSTTEIEEESVLFTAEPVIDFSEEDEAETNIPFTANDTITEDTSADNDELKSTAPTNEIGSAALPLEESTNKVVEDEENKEFESALIAYESEDSLADEAIADITDQTEESTTLADDFQAIDTSTSNISAPIAITDTELQSAISDEIIEQLMPELEQRIRDVVQQVLKEKLSNSPPKFTA